MTKCCDCGLEIDATDINEYYRCFFDQKFEDTKKHYQLCRACSDAIKEEMDSGRGRKPDE